jgi:hypothetical protein
LEFKVLDVLDALHRGTEDSIVRAATVTRSILGTFFFLSV